LQISGFKFAFFMVKADHLFLAWNEWIKTRPGFRAVCLSVSVEETKHKCNSKRNGTAQCTQC